MSRLTFPGRIVKIDGNLVTIEAGRIDWVKKLDEKGNVIGRLQKWMTGDSVSSRYVGKIIKVFVRQ